MVKKKSEQTKRNDKSLKNVLKKVIGEGWEEGIKEAESTIEKLTKYKIHGKPYSVSSLKSYFDRIASMIKNNGKWGIPEETVERYKQEAKKYHKEVKKEVKEKEVIKWEEIEEAREKLKEIAKDTKNFNDYLDWMIIALYTLMSPEKVDYANMKIIKNYGKEMAKKNNYIEWEEDINKESKIIIHSYQMKKEKDQEKGVIIREIPHELKKIIKKWFKKYNTKKENLLVRMGMEKEGKNGEIVVMTKNNLGKRIEGIFKRILGKKIGLMDLRNAYNEKPEEEVEKKPKKKVKIV
jgi:hypothetical protein